MRAGRSIRAVAMSVLLIGMAIAGAFAPIAPTDPVEPASAEWSDECDFQSPLAKWKAVKAAYNTVSGANSGCRWDPGESTDWENKSATQAYAAALGMSDSVESYGTTTSNWLEDTRAVAMSKAKIEIVNELNNGSTESQVKFQANQTATDYYSQIQQNVIADREAKVQELQFIDNQTSAEIRAEKYVSGADYRQVMNVSIDFHEYDVDLLNGSTMEVTAGLIHDPNDKYRAYSPVQQAVEHNGNNYLSRAGAAGRNWWVVDTPDRFTRIWSANETGPYSSLMNEIEAQHQQVKDNMGAYVDGVYNQYEAGDIDASELMDPTDLAHQATTDYNSTGYYGYAAVQLAALGQAGDLNTSHVIELDNGATWEGTLFYTGEDVDSFVTGETYNPDNLSGSVSMAVSDAPEEVGTGIQTVDQPFTIQSATNTKTGESVEETTIEKHVYESTDASQLESEMEQLRQLIEEYENTDPGGGGPLLPGIGIGFGGGGGVLGLIVVLVGGVYLLGRSNS